MSLQEQFEKAVNVIRNLPKNGSYQPSHELQLRFYAYYKQATEGPNIQARPSFWDVIKRAKWDAWTRLGSMTKEEAMIHYVGELRKIVETMSYSDNVANFVHSLDSFYDNVPQEDLEMVVGHQIIKKIRSRANSPLNGSPLESRDTSPSRDSPTLRMYSREVKIPSKYLLKSSLETTPASSHSTSPNPPETDDDEEDHFLDTQTEPDRGKDGAVKKVRPDEASGNQSRSSASNHFTDLNGTGENTCEENTESSSDLHMVNNRINFSLENTEPAEVTHTNLENCNGFIPNDVQHRNALEGESMVTSEAFKKAIAHLTKEMECLQRRMAALECEKPQKTNAASVHNRGRTLVPKWWNLSLPTTAALLMWPVLLLLMSKWMSNRRRH